MVTKTFLLLTVAVCVLPSTAQAFYWGRSFQGVSVGCTAQDIKVTPGPHREYDIRGGKRAEMILYTAEPKGEFRYTIRGESVGVPSRKLGTVKKAFTLPAWAFTCTIASEERAAHTCDGKLQGTSGSCIVCREGPHKDSCKRLTFAIKREAHKMPQMAEPPPG